MIESFLTRFFGASGGTSPSCDSHARAEALEPRTLLTVVINSPIDDQLVNANSPPTSISIADRYDAPDLVGTIARFDTVLGVINVLLEDGATPATVANFLRYIDADLWDNTIFHRSVSNFVIQGGGFVRPDLDFDPPRQVPTFDPVVNEPGISNLRGTIAMAKQGGDPNSATSQWFFNLGNNSANLDNQNGGFTVFGHIILGLDVMDAIAAVPTFEFESPFEELPLRDFQNGEGVDVSDYIGMNVSRGEKLTYSVISSTPDLVSATLDGTTLTLTYAEGREGASNITVRTTAADGTFADDTFTVTVGARPAVAAVNASPDGNVRRGVPTTLTATGVSGPLNPVTAVQFFHDTNGDGLLDPNVDSLLGTDTDGQDGYTSIVQTSAFGTGQQRFFARALDATGAIGDSVSTTITVIVGPQISTFFAAPGTSDRKSKIALTASGFDVAPAQLRQVEYFYDTDGNNQFDPAVDKRLKSVSRAPGDRATVFVSTSKFRAGTNTLFARAKDSFGDYGEVIAATVEIVNIAPSLTSVKPDRSTIWGPGAPLSLSVKGAKDADGRLSRVEYFRDSGDAPDGVFDAATDTHLGTIFGPSGSLKLRVDTSAFALGVNRVFARVIDLEGGISRTVTAAVYVNAAPSIEAFVAAPTSGIQSNNFTLEATGVRDPDGVVKKVEFYWDTNRDGIINKGDRKLGNAKLSSGIWSLTIRGRQLSLGENLLLARAFDDARIAGPLATSSLSLTQA